MGYPYAVTDHDGAGSRHSLDLMPVGVRYEHIPRDYGIGTELDMLLNHYAALASYSASSGLFPATQDQSCIPLQVDMNAWTNLEVTLQRDRGSCRTGDRAVFPQAAPSLDRKRSRHLNSSSLVAVHVQGQSRIYSDPHRPPAACHPSGRKYASDERNTRKSRGPIKIRREPPLHRVFRQYPIDESSHPRQALWKTS